MRRPRRATRGVLCLVAVLAVAGLVLAWLQAPVLLDHASAWAAACERTPLIAALVAVLLLTAWSLALPTAIPILIMGYLFGLLTGSLLTIVATTSAYLIAYGVGRRAPAWLHAALERRPWWIWLEGAVRRGGWRVVLALRLSPVVPFPWQNYVYGLVRVPLVPCTCATLAGKIPAVLVTAATGALVRSGQRSWEDGVPPQWGWILLVIGIAGTAAALLLLLRARMRVPREDPAESS